MPTNISANEPVYTVLHMQTSAAKPTQQERIVSEIYQTLQANPAQLADEHWLRQSMAADFIKIFGGTAENLRCFAAPARINLIGEHIDYNGGKVFPAALDKYLYMTVRRREDDQILIRNLQLPGEYRRTLSARGIGNNELSYSLYLDGILELIQKAGLEATGGFEALIFTTVPRGGGVSSSAALELCYATLLQGLFPVELSRLELAKIAQLAEHEYVGVQCGIMDQFAVAFGKAGQAMLLDTGTLEYEYVPLDLGDHCIVLMNSNYPRTLAGSKYNERRAECMQGLAIAQETLPIKNLCDMNIAQFDQLAQRIADPVIRKRVKHCVHENNRVHKSVLALREGRLAEFGQLMNQSHISLRDDYEVSGDALDALFGAASSHPDCLGARMTGAGFGGCAIALVKRSASEDFMAKVGTVYKARTGLQADFYQTMAGDGAREL